MTNTDLAAGLAATATRLLRCLLQIKIKMMLIVLSAYEIDYIQKHKNGHLRFRNDGLYPAYRILLASILKII